MVRGVTYRAPLAGRGRILVPSRVPRIMGGVGMHGACSLPGLAAAWALQATTRLAVAPFSLKAIAPELPPVDWESWRKENIPWAASPDRWVIGLPADPRRRRFHILLLDESHRQVGFAKFSTNPLAEFAVRVREHLDRSDPSTFWTPRLLAHGAVSGWHFTVDSAMPEGFHRPARLAPERRRAILDEIRGILRQGLGSDVVHGDFGPWNVRSIKGHPVIVLDWEEASPGSAGMDELWHAVNVGLMGSLDVTGAEIAEHLDRVTLERVGETARELLARLSGPEPPEVRPGSVLSSAGQRLHDAQRRVLRELAQR